MSSSSSAHAAAESNYDVTVTQCDDDGLGYDASMTSFDADDVDDVDDADICSYARRVRGRA